MMSICFQSRYLFCPSSFLLVKMPQQLHLFRLQSFFEALPLYDLSFLFANSLQDLTCNWLTTREGTLVSIHERDMTVYMHALSRCHAISNYKRFSWVYIHVIGHLGQQVVLISYVDKFKIQNTHNFRSIVPIWKRRIYTHTHITLMGFDTSFDGRSLGIQH